jgi:hypothetical protein
MALPLQNTSDGGINGNQITVANSGGASGDPIDSVVGTGPTYSTDHLLKLHPLVLKPITTGSGGIQWTNTQMGALALVFGRCYYYFTGAPAAAAIIATMRKAGANISAIRINTDMTFSASANGTTWVAGSSVIPTNEWVRFGWRAELTGSLVKMTARYYRIADSYVPTETVTPADVADATASFTGIRYGALTAYSSQMYFVAVMATAADYPGPDSPDQPSLAIARAA